MDTDDSVRSHLRSTISEALEARDAVAFVHAGSEADPAIRYCWSRRGAVAIAFDGQEWLIDAAANASTHPAERLASRLAERVESTLVLTPARIPHDAALYLETAGFELASTDVIDAARATKTATECERIAAVQAAASAGIRSGASLLADAVGDDGRLVADGRPVTPERLRTAIDEAIVSAGAFPAGNTVVNPDPGHTPSSRDAGDDTGTEIGKENESERENENENETRTGTGTGTEPTDHNDSALRPGEPIVLEATPRGPDGYYGSLVRTLVVDGDGGRERRAHVGVTQSFQSARAMLTADTESVTRVEADLEAEVRAFGFGEGEDVRTRVAGVGLEPRERPLEGGDQIEPGSVVRLESAVHVADGQWLRIADLLVKGETGERPELFEGPSRSLEPTALLED
nr:M24 family metallopeptidase [Natronorubrum halalkaliphilum]